MGAKRVHIYIPRLICRFSLSQSSTRSFTPLLVRGSPRISSLVFTAFLPAFNPPDDDRPPAKELNSGNALLLLGFSIQGLSGGPGPNGENWGCSRYAIGATLGISV